MSSPAVRVSGLVGRAKVANGVYEQQPGLTQHRRPVYMQANVAATGGRGASRLCYDKTPGETPAWMVSPHATSTTTGCIQGCF